MEFELKNVRLAFPDLHKKNKDDKFGGSFIFPTDHPQIEALKKVMQQVAKDKWAEKAPAIFKVLEKKDRICLHDGEDKALKYDGFAGMLYVSTSSKVKPGLFERDLTPIEEDEGQLYSGCYVNAIIDVWAMDSKDFGQRICAGLTGVRFRKNAEAFGGGKKAEASQFSALDDEEEDDIGNEFT